MVFETTEEIRVLPKMPKNSLIFVVDRGFANENILNSLNELGLNQICRVRLDVTVTQKPKEAVRLKKTLP